MVNAPSAPRQPTPGEATSQPQVCPPDSDLPENSQENLDAKLDHAIEESFPTSDPVSVTVTKQAVAQEPEKTASTTPTSPSREGQGQTEQETAENLLDQVKHAMQDVAETASGTARDAYGQGQRYLRQAQERYPEAERYYREGRRAVSQRIGEAPLLSLLVAGAAGYALAWIFHGGRRARDRRVPDYARTRRGYAPYRDKQHEE